MKNKKVFSNKPKAIQQTKQMQNETRLILHIAY